MTTDTADKRLWFLKLLKRTIEQTESDMIVGTQLAHITGITVERTSKKQLDAATKLRVEKFNDNALESSFSDLESIYDTLWDVAIRMAARAVRLMSEEELNDLLDTRNADDSKTCIPDAAR